MKGFLRMRIELVETTLLMRQRNAGQTILIKGLVDEAKQVGVHSPLCFYQMIQIAPSGSLLQSKQTFKERIATIGESGSLQIGFVDTRKFGRLLHHGRQLFLIANQYETMNRGQTRLNVVGKEEGQ